MNRGLYPHPQLVTHILRTGKSVRRNMLISRIRGRGCGKCIHHSCNPTSSAVHDGPAVHIDPAPSYMAWQTCEGAQPPAICPPRNMPTRVHVMHAHVHWPLLPTHVASCPQQQHARHVVGCATALLRMRSCECPCLKEVQKREKNQPLQVQHAAARAGARAHVAGMPMDCAHHTHSGPGQKQGGRVPGPFCDQSNREPSRLAFPGLSANRRQPPCTCVREPRSDPETTDDPAGRRKMR